MSYTEYTNILMFLDYHDGISEELAQLDELDWFMRCDHIAFLRAWGADLYYCYVQPKHVMKAIQETNLYVPTARQFMDAFPSLERED